MAYGTVNADVIQSSVSGVSLGAGNATSFKNRIINGAMVIDQRNAGASYTVAGSANVYVLDRWRFWVNGGGGSGAQYTVQQSSVSPAGFTTSMLVTQTGSATLTGTQYNLIAQYIEGFNVADLGWGGASAQTVTLSFWIRSSLTGTFGGVLSNSAQNRSYPFSYTISSANTWEQKTITVVGDTSGTWLTTTGTGLQIYFDLGSGSGIKGTAGAWAGATYLGATGAGNWVGTNGATLYITGVQLEVGSSATGFDFRSYGTELALCQRYFYALAGNGTVVDQYLAAGHCNASTQARFAVSLPSTMRVQPTITPNSASNFNVYSGSVAPACTDVAATSSTASTNTPSIGVYATVASGLTAGYGAVLLAAGTSAKLSFSAEL